MTDVTPMSGSSDIKFSMKPKRKKVVKRILLASIMNIMLVTVTERTREIGIKKAIGAQRSVIVTQFLVESGVLSALGGLIGIAIGYAGSLVLGKLIYDLILFPSALVTFGAAGFSVVIGVVFGLYPAVKASGLQPVDALRAD